MNRTILLRGVSLCPVCKTEFWSLFQKVKENRGQEKEAPDLTEIISMFMGPFCVREWILHLPSVFLNWFVVLENFMHLLAGRKLLIRLYLTWFTTKHIIGRFCSCTQSWPAEAHIILEGHFRDVMDMNLHFITGCCVCSASAWKQVLWAVMRKCAVLEEAVVLVMDCIYFLFSNYWPKNLFSNIFS